MNRLVDVILQAGAVAVLTGLIVFFILWFAHEEAAPGPQQVFEAHLLALDEGRLDDALGYVDTASCGTTAVDGAEEALASLKLLGYTFSTAFPVAEVWILVGGDKALLSVEFPTNIPLTSVQYMHRVEGDWRVACE